MTSLKLTPVRAKSRRRRWTLLTCLTAVACFIAGAPSASAATFERVRDINPGTPGSGFADSVELNDVSYFLADDGVHGTELWRTDGSSAGTSLVKDIRPGSQGSADFLESTLVVMDDAIYLAANDGVNGNELWRSDGTDAGTTMVEDIYPKATGSAPGGLAVVNGALWFAADHPTYGSELWRSSDGTAANTELVKDINPGMDDGSPNSGSPSGFVQVGGFVYFQAGDLLNGEELWRSNGTEVGTTLVKDIKPGPDGSVPLFFEELNGELYFVAEQATDDWRLWRSDGTTVTPVGALGAFAPNDVENVGNTLYLLPDDGAHGTELWRHDGTTGNTELVKDINPGPVGSDTNVLHEGAGGVFFKANDGANGAELWRSDGTEGGTVMVSDINPGAAGSDAAELSFFGIPGGHLFEANDGVHGTELWWTDGTGTVLLRDFLPGAGSGMPQAFAELNGSYLLNATDGTAGAELWKITGDLADDSDGDGVADGIDNCPSAANLGQANVDGDSQGDACDADDDNDGVADASDACPAQANPTATGCPAPGPSSPSGGGSGGSGDGTADTSAPNVLLGGAKRQRAGRTVALTVTCSEACSMVASASVWIPRAGKALRLKTARRTLAAGQKASLKLKMSKRTLKAIRSALRRGGKRSVKIKVTVTDAAGNSRTLSRRVRLKL